MTHRTYHQENLEDMLQDALASVEIPDENRVLIDAYYETNLRQMGTLYIARPPKDADALESMIAQLAKASVDEFILCHTPQCYLEFDWSIQHYGYYLQEMCTVHCGWGKTPEALRIRKY